MDASEQNKQGNPARQTQESSSSAMDTENIGIAPDADALAASDRATAEVRASEEGSSTEDDSAYPAITSEEQAGKEQQGAAAPSRLPAAQNNGLANGGQVAAPPAEASQLPGSTLPAGTPSFEPDPASVDYHSPLVQCITLLFKLSGKPISPNIISSKLPSGPSALRPSMILRAAESIGLRSSTVARPKLENISPLTFPCIILLKGNGACILAGLDESSATVYFPEHGGGSVTIPREQLEQQYLGYAIYAKVMARLDARASKLKLVKTKRWFWDTLLGFLPIYKHVIAASILINLFALAGPLFTMNVYDRVIPNAERAWETLWALAIGVVITYIFDFLLRNLRSYFVDVAGRNADVILGGKLMQQVLSLRLDSKPDSTGSMTNNLREFESLRDFFGSTTLTTLIDIPFMFVFLFIMFLIGGPIVLVPLAAIPIVLVVGYFLQLPMQNITEKGFKENMQKNALLVEVVNGLETVKTSQAEGTVFNTWEKVIGLSALSNAHSKRLATFSMSITTLLTQLVSMGIIIVGVYLVNEKTITMGVIIACNMLSGRTMAPLAALSSMFARLQQSRMALKALDTIMALPTENTANDSYVDFGHLEASLRLEKISFKYPNTEKNALDNVSTTIRAGEKVGIIGAMGSGKSTLGRLCVGLYQPSEGSVSMGGVDLRQMDVTTLRSRIGYVSQDNYLFYGTVRENIAFGNANVDDKLILRAANIAGVSDFVRQNPAGFGMQVGERGMNLSGGQRQSVAIARALLKDPDILIMDEPSSNMDNHSENLLKHRLGMVVARKTLVLITHRLSMLDVVDRIIVMDKGRIYADGPKDKVMAFLRNEQSKSMQSKNVTPEQARRAV